MGGEMNTTKLRALIDEYNEWYKSDKPHAMSQAEDVMGALPALLDRLDKLEERLLLADGLAQSLSTYPPETLYFETCFILKEYYTARGEK